MDREVFILIGHNTEAGDTWISGVYESKATAERARANLKKMRDDTFIYYVSKHWLNMKERAVLSCTM